MKTIHYNRRLSCMHIVAGISHVDPPTTAPATTASATTASAMDEIISDLTVDYRFYFPVIYRHACVIVFHVVYCTVLHVHVHHCRLIMF